VSLVDLAATIPELLGLPAPSHHAGTSLVPLMRGGGEQGPAHVFMESGTHPARTQLSIRRGRWKLIEVRSPADRARMTGEAVELYDVAADPLEKHDLAAAHPRVVAELRQALQHWHVEASRARSETGAPVSPRSLDPRERRLLEELGYLEPAPAAP
jgi:arylsulfatase A-like enzyme